MATFSTNSISMWTSSLPSFDLDSGDIHLYLAHLQISPHLESNIMSFLSADEITRSKSFRFLKDRSAYIAARGYLRMLLAKYIDKSPREISLSYTAEGKPFISPSKGIHFNLSHSGNRAVLGFSKEGPIGVDIELVKREVNIDLVARHSFSMVEQQKLFSLPSEQQREAFFTCWTRKEAFIKAKGEGMSIPLDEFEVSLVPGEKPELRHAEWDPEEPSRWTFNDLPRIEGYIGAWACGGEIQHIHTYNLKETFLTLKKG